VRPEVRNSKFAQKLSKKVDSSKKLTRFQTKYLKKNSLKTGNQLVTICGFCKKEVVRNCAKPVKQRVDANAIKSIPKQKKRSKKEERPVLWFGKGSGQFSSGTNKWKREKTIFKWDEDKQYWCQD
jgi:hypothetical protein